MATETEIRPDCIEIFKRLEEKSDITTHMINDKLDELIKRDSQRVERYEDHVKSSMSYRIMVERHEEILKDIVSLKRWWMGAAVTIGLAVLALAVTWGVTVEKVSRLEKCVYAETKTDK